ncbi:hypothetical protein OG747_40630 [Streptomyces sp. NBC_01384]|uniref:hypothetical protein n=1 Tax=Streptomyces sp. NBC_01384 TaxID=2903847 RepID=UPI00324EFA56
MLLPQNIVAVVTDNDGNDARDVQQRYSRYTAQPNISVHVGEDATYKTLEPQLFKVNGLTDLNAVLGQSHRTDTALLDYMSKHKTDCALAIFESDQTVTMPSYITEAIDAVS